MSVGSALVLELVCSEMRIKDGAVIDLKKQLRLARNNQARLRKENATLRGQAFNCLRSQSEMAKEIANYVVNVHAISCAMARIT